MIKDLVLKNRSYRRFYHNEKISQQTLAELVDLTRFTPSASNVQALKFRIVNSNKECEQLFPLVHWAGLIPEWGGPKDDERPAAYIIILTDLTIRKDTKTDDGIAAQTIMLGATEKGLGGCIMGAIDRSKILNLFDLDSSHYSVELVLALGKPKEIIKITNVKSDGNTKYYRDEQQIHYVPKRSLEEIIIK